MIYTVWLTSYYCILLKAHTEQELQDMIKFSDYPKATYSRTHIYDRIPKKELE